MGKFNLRNKVVIKAYQCEVKWQARKQERPNLDHNKTVMTVTQEKGNAFKIMALLCQRNMCKHNVYIQVTVVNKDLAKTNILNIQIKQDLLKKTVKPAFCHKIKSLRFIFLKMIFR